MLKTIVRPPVSAPLPAMGASAAVTVEMDGCELIATSGDTTLVRLRYDEAEHRLDLQSMTGEPDVDERALAAVLEAVFGSRPELASITFGSEPYFTPTSEFTRHLLRTGLLRRDVQGLGVHAECFMQRRGNWLLDGNTPPYPLDYVLTEGRRHPRRPPKPEGVIYARHITWLDQSISFRALTPNDAPTFSRWMNDPRVATVWNEAGSLETHRRYLSKLIADPHMLPLIGCFDDRPFAYFEVYWAKENRIAPFYDADDYDRGWHVAVGEEAFRGRRYISAWLPSLMHYMFLDDPRTRRIVGEPACSHIQQIRNLEVSGFAKLKTFDFPHKRALLVMLLRERFFGERLWLPAPASRSEAAQ